MSLAACNEGCTASAADRTVVGWGYNAYGQASPPAGLSGVAAKPTFDGVGNYSYILTGVDNATRTDPNPASNPDQFGLRFRDPTGTEVSDLTFDPTNVSNGNIFVGKS